MTRALGRRRRAPATWFRAGIRLVEQHERRRHAGGSDGVLHFDLGLLVSSLHVQTGNVDDAGELADAVEEDREVVIGAFELERDRPLGVQLLGDRRRSA